MTVRTRFAPSPTGFIHLGNIRSALYPWAYARATGGTFVLRIEDTDLERSSQQAVDAILESMQWLGLDPDEGPYYQMQRMDRYKAVLARMLDEGLAYRCYMSPAELDAMRERQMAAKQKPRYDGTWRPEPGKALPPVPEGVTRWSAFARRWAAPWRGTTRSRDGWSSATTSSTISSLRGRTARPPTTSAWWWTTSTCGSRMSSAATTT
jgi:hypothetical protein